MVPSPTPFFLPRIKENEEKEQIQDREKAWIRQSGKGKERSIEGIPETCPPSEQN